MAIEDPQNSVEKFSELYRLMWDQVSDKEQMLHYVLNHNKTTYKIGMFLANLIQIGAHLDVSRAREFPWTNKMLDRMWDAKKYGKQGGLLWSSSSDKCCLKRPFQLWHVMKQLIQPNFFEWTSQDIDDILDFYQNLPSVTKADNNKKNKIIKIMNENFISVIDWYPHIFQDRQKQVWYTFMEVQWLLYSYYTTTDNKFSRIAIGSSLSERQQSLAPIIEDRLPHFLDYIKPLKLIEPNYSIELALKNYKEWIKANRPPLSEGGDEITIHLS